MSHTSTTWSSNYSIMSHTSATWQPLPLPPWPGWVYQLNNNCPSWMASLGMLKVRGTGGVGLWMNGCTSNWLSASNRIKAFSFTQINNSKPASHYRITIVDNFDMISGRGIEWRVKQLQRSIIETLSPSIPTEGQHRHLTDIEWFLETTQWRVIEWWVCLPPLPCH